LIFFVFNLTSNLVIALEITNKYGMVNIPAGSFTMGACKESLAMVEENKQRAYLGQPKVRLSCTPDLSANYIETPQRQVKVAAFQLGRMPVTVSQFKQFIIASTRHELLTDDFMLQNKKDSFPVVLVSFYDAKAFIDWLNDTNGGGWRLPSEAEWEYACRAGGNHIYCGTNNKEDTGIFSEVPNAFGLYAMNRAAWQMVEDCWHDNYNGAPNNAKAWITNCSSNKRVERGGSWISSSSQLRITSRSVFNPESRTRINLGFRLARSF
jgi:formylglycine-generating enzyme required for sulfatase activity